MIISDIKKEEIRKKMRFLKIYEKDLIEKFILGSGKGGQKKQKTFSCVYLKHIPTNIEVKCQKSRFRENNRFFARKMVCEIFLKKILKVKTKKEEVLEKRKKQKKRRKRRVKDKI